MELICEPIIMWFNAVPSIALPACNTGLAVRYATLRSLLRHPATKTTVCSINYKSMIASVNELESS